MKAKKTRGLGSPVFVLSCLISLIGLIYVSLGPFVASFGVFPGLLFNELLLILFPALGLRSLFQLREPRERDKGGKFWLVSLAIVSAFPLILFVNGLFLSLLSHFLELENDGLEILRANYPVGRQVFFLALIPALAEEFFFRGTLENLLIRYGKPRAVWLSALIFALFHFELQNFLAPFLFGLLLGYIYLRTRNLAYLVYGHFLHNCISILFIQVYNEGVIGQLSSSKLVKFLGNVQTFSMLVLFFVGLMALIGLRYSIKGMGAWSLRENKPCQLRIKDLSPLLFLFGVYLYMCI